MHGAGRRTARRRRRTAARPAARPRPRRPGREMDKPVRIEISPLVRKRPAAILSSARSRASAANHVASLLAHAESRRSRSSLSGGRSGSNSSHGDTAAQPAGRPASPPRAVSVDQLAGAIATSLPSSRAGSPPAMSSPSSWAAAAAPADGEASLAVIARLRRQLVQTQRQCISYEERLRQVRPRHCPAVCLPAPPSNTGKQLHALC
jgi:hypothetical protein